LSYASGSLTGIPAYHTAFDMPLPGVLHAACPHFYRFGRDGEAEAEFTDRMIEDLTTLIDREGAHTVAAFIAEPVMGTGGVLLPPTGYFEKVQKLLAEKDILFIVDEVITGFGRTGKWFGTSTYGLKPDIINLAKGITSGYFPVSATVVSDGIWSVLTAASAKTGAVMHGFTYSGHPVGSAIAAANLDIMEREDLVGSAALKGPEMLQALRTRVADHPYIGDVRGVGLMLAVEFVAEKKSRTPFPIGSHPHRLVSKLAKEKGVLARPLPFIDVISFSPPLSITMAEIDEGIEKFSRALNAALPELRALSTS
jgi:L-2,4-diaminobutyrate transaminase